MRLMSVGVDVAFDTEWFVQPEKRLPTDGVPGHPALHAVCSSKVGITHTLHFSCEDDGGYIALYFGGFANPDTP